MQEDEKRMQTSKQDQSKSRTFMEREEKKPRVTAVSREKTAVEEKRNRFQTNTVKSKNQIKYRLEEIWS